MTKTARRLLAIFLILADANVQADTCYTPAQLTQIADQLQRADRLDFELQEYKRLQTSSVEVAWYSDPTLVVGGLVVSFGVGALVGYAIGRGK